MAKRDRELEQIKIELCEEICLNALKEANIPIGKYVFKVSPLRKYNGLCTSPVRKGEPHEIKIASKLLKDGVCEDALLGTIGHELLHTCPERIPIPHNKLFMKRAEILYQKGIYANVTYGDDFFDHPDQEYIEVICDCGQKQVYPLFEQKQNTVSSCTVCGKNIIGENGCFYHEDGNPLKIRPYKKSSHTPL